MAGDDNEAAAGEADEVCSPLESAFQGSRTAQRLKAALWYSIGQMVDDESIRSNTNATPQYIGALTELAWSQLGTFSPSPLLCAW